MCRLALNLNACLEMDKNSSSGVGDRIRDTQTSEKTEDDSNKSLCSTSLLDVRS